MHALFVAVTFTTLTGFLLLVHFDHDYLPDMGDVSGWTDRSRVHGVGVVILITGFFALHMLVLHAYVMRVKSYHDFRDLCGGLGGGGREWPALGKGGAAEAHLLPVLRRGVYVGTISVYLMVFVVFAFFFIFEVRALCSPLSRYTQVFMSALTVRRAQVELVVLVEYLLLFVFVAVSLVNLTLGHRIWRVYGVV